MIDKLRTFKLPSQDYGDVYVAPVPIAEDGSWGVLEPLRGTVWGALIPTVPGEAMAEARHGRSKPLMQVIGRPPHALMKMASKVPQTCRQQKECGSFRQKDCQPGQKLPDCYEPPNLPEDATSIARLVALAWRDGIYVVLVEGKEFSF